MYRRVPLSMLTEGCVLASAVRDDALRMLIGPGMAITNDFMAGLYKRGVHEVVITEKDWRRLNAFASHGKARKAAPRHATMQSKFHTDSSRRLDDEAAGTSCDIVPAEDPFASRLRRPGAVSYSRDDMDRMVDHHQQSVDQVGELLKQLADGQGTGSEAVQKLAGNALERATQDLDLCMGINPSEKTDIFTHSTNVATLAIGLGATLGQNAQALEELGMGCLLHDAGMLRIDQRIAQSNEFISENEFVEIAKHPVIATDMLYKNMGRVPLGVRMIVYQMHERCDGSGYPRGRTGDAIHPLAKIAAVADAYVALVSRRSYRPATLPYYAMAKMLEDVKGGLYAAPVVRALLQTFSLFPIGSYVELNDGRVAKTIRANGPAYDRPIVEAWDRMRLKDAPAIIDLSNEPDLSVAKPLALLR